MPSPGHCWHLGSEPAAESSLIISLSLSVSAFQVSNFFPGAPLPELRLASSVATLVRPSSLRRAPVCSRGTLTASFLLQALPRADPSQPGRHGSKELGQRCVFREPSTQRAEQESFQPLPSPLTQHLSTQLRFQWIRTLPQHLQGPQSVSSRGPQCLMAKHNHTIGRSVDSRNTCQSLFLPQQKMELYQHMASEGY